MTPKYGIYINCKDIPFVDLILLGMKPYETRTRNTLKKLIGHTVYIIETGTSSVPVVKGIATIKRVFKMDYNSEAFRYSACIEDTPYDIKPNGTKFFYHLTNVKKIEPFKVPDNRINHGRSYTEF